MIPASDPAAAVATARVQVSSELDDLLAQLRKRAASHDFAVASGGVGQLADAAS